MMATLVIILNYFHDLSVALLASNIFVVYILGRYLENHPGKDEIMTHTFAKLSRITWGTLASVIILGAVRAYYFMELEWNPAAGKDQIPALIVKHVVLVSLTVFALLSHRKYQRKYGRK